MVILIIDRKAAALVKQVNQDRKSFVDRRIYYEAGTTLIVVRGGWSLGQLVNRRVDANIGWDTAYPGFTLDEAMIGQRRRKITIYKPVSNEVRYDHFLSDLLQEE